MNTDAKKILKIVTLVSLFAFIAVYAFFNTKDLLFGVKIRNVNIVGETNIRKISGNAKNAKILTLNGREISIDQSGNFEETLALLSGYNIITLSAEDKFGLRDEKNYQLIGIAD